MQIYQNTSFGALFRRYIAPSVISAIFFSIYAIIDGIIVGSYLGSENVEAVLENTDGYVIGEIVQGEGVELC